MRLLPKPARLAALCVFLLSGTAWAGDGGSLYGFGDSLTDDGNFPKYTGLDYPPPPYYDHHFTNGDVYLQYLPGLTGLDFSPANDFAVGGAFATSGSLFPPYIPGVATQIAMEQAAGLHFNPHDVVVLWAGSNNYFGILDGLPNNAVIGDPTVQADIGQVVGAVTQDAASLIGMGARNLVVLNVPNLGITPAYLGSPQRALATGLAEEHDAELPGQIKALQARTGANIYYISTLAEINAVLAHPGYFGLVNTTQECILTPACVHGSQAVQDTYLFWDDVHPTTGIHYLQAEIIANQLNADQAVGAQGQLVLAQSQNFADSLQRHLAGLAGGGATTGVHVWAQGDYEDGQINGAGSQSGFRFHAGNALVGAENTLVPEFTLGVSFGYGQPHADFSGNVATLAYNAYSAAAYAEYQAGQFYSSGVLGVGFFDSDQSSRAGINDFFGVIDSAPNAHTISASWDTGLNFGDHDLTYGPVAGIDFTHVDIDAYTESTSNGAAALIEAQNFQHVGAQTFSSLVGNAGVRVQLNATPIGAWLQPALTVTADREFMDGARDLTSSFLTAGMPITTRLPGYEASYGEASLQLRHDVMDNVSIWGDLSSSFARSYGNDQSFALKVAVRF